MAMTPVAEVDYGALLNTARAAYNNLMLGLSPRVFVDQNGERVEYNAANSAKLAQYILTLEVRCGVAGALGPATGVFGRFC